MKLGTKWTRVGAKGSSAKSKTYVTGSIARGRGKSPRSRTPVGKR